MQWQKAAERLVGRDGELSRLLALLDDAAAGRPSHALIGGEAGVGKTRLVDEIAGQAVDRGFAVLAGRCAELGDSIPYLPLADALRDAMTGPAVPGPLRDALAARPVLGRLLPDRGGAAPDGSDLHGLAQQQLFGAALGMLAEVAAASPVLLVLEDLHWADRSTRDLVTFLSRVLHRERVAVLATYRTDDLHRSHPLRPVVAELLRLPNVTAVELGPLGYPDLAEHLSALAGRPVDQEALHQIVTRAEGNAYYAEELLAAAQGSAARRHAGGGSGGWGGTGLGGASQGGAMLPTGLAALLLARVERLSRPAQQVLRAAAVSGRRMEDDIVREASGLAAPDYDEAIREAVARQLLVPDSAQGYAFRHALIREAVYADLLAGERTRLHARFAALLADEVRLTTVPGTAAELAHHCLASHDIDGAFAASVRAAGEAETLGAPAEAQEHYDRALGLWDRAAEPEKLAGMDRATLAFRSAASAGASGDVARAVHKLRRLKEALAGDGDLAPGIQVGDPSLASRVSERLAYFLMEAGEMADALAAAQDAVDALPAEPATPGLARALATHAQALFYADDELAAAARAREATAVAGAAGAPWLEADSLVTLAQVAERDGRTADTIELLVTANDQAFESGMLGVELRASFHLARVRLEHGDLAGAAATAHEGFARAEQAGLGLAPYGLDLQYIHYLAHYADGCWDHAQELADGFGVRVTTVAEARLSAMALFIDVARGSPVVAERRAWMEPFWPEDSFGEYIARGLLAEQALWRGDTGATLAEVAVALRAGRQDDCGWEPPAIRVAAIGLAARADRAALARAAGQDETAAVEVAAADVLIEVAREGAAFARRPSFVLGVDGRGWLARAEAEWRRAHGSNDPDAWQAVVDVFSPGFAYETARSRWRLAEALSAAGHREEAAGQLAQAAEVAGRLGAAPLQSAAADLARRARLGPRQGGYRPPGPLAALTGREREVLRLLAAGRSNREIAAALFIAPKTASVHVSNILGKLGAASRTEAAAIAHRETADGS